MRNLLVLVSLIITNILMGQSNINPDISLIGTFNTYTNFINDAPEKGKINFEDPSLEMFIDGYLNPYAKATAGIAYHENEFAAEEVYFEVLRGLPLDMQVKAGKYLLGFGRINTIHEHAWAFLNRPLSHKIYFGEEGLNDVGINLSFVLPTEDFFTNFDIGVYKGNSFRGIGGHNHEEEIHADEENHEEFELQEIVSPVVLSRLSSFFPITDYSNLEIGLNAAIGTLGKAELENSELKNINFAYAGLDFKYKYKPNTYKAFTVQGEVFLNHRNVIRENHVTESFYLADDINTLSGFIYLDYQFNKIFNVGLKYDHTYGIIGDEHNYNTLANDDKNKTTSISGWFGYYPIEETLALRLGLEHLMFKYDEGTNRDNETTIKLQAIFSLGPHKAHKF